MPREARASEEFFYLDDAGQKQDRELHEPIIRAHDFPIVEEIMAPIRAKHKAKWDAARAAAQRRKRWIKARARAEMLVARSQNDLYTGSWNEQDHPRHPAGSPEGGQFAGGGGSQGPGKPDAVGAGDRRAVDEEPPHPYRRESPSEAQSGRDVVAVWRPTEAATEAIEARGHTPLTLYEIGGTGGAKQFHAAIQRAKVGEWGASVTAYAPADYEGMRLFLSPDGLNGFALRDDDIVSVFKHPDSAADGVATTMLALAIGEGGRRLDAFDTQLPELYSKSGFKAVARLKWNDQYAPDGWDKDTYADYNGGEPDVVFMVYEPITRPYIAGEGRTVEDYDAGTLAQLDQLATVPSPSPHAKDPTSASALLRIEPRVTADTLYGRVPGSSKLVAEARAKLKQAVATDKTEQEGGHKLPNGNWAPDRIPVHRAIVAKLMPESEIAAAVAKPGEQPTLYILGGRGGSGKGWFTNAKRGGTIDRSTAVYLNSDDVKEALPEYRGWNAGLVHEESTEIVSAMEQYARDNRLNVILDGTLKSGTSTAKRIAAYKAAGYKISGHYMYASPVVAAERALERFVRGQEKTGKGRFVPPEYSLSSLTNEESFDNHRHEMDYWEVYDNMGSSPRFHSRKGG